MCGSSFRRPGGLAIHLRLSHFGAGVFDPALCTMLMLILDAVNEVEVPYYSDAETRAAAVNAIKRHVLTGGWRRALYSKEPGRAQPESVLGVFCDALENIAYVLLTWHFDHGLMDAVGMTLRSQLSTVPSFTGVLLIVFIRRCSNTLACPVTYLTSCSRETEHTDSDDANGINLYVSSRTVNPRKLRLDPAVVDLVVFDNCPSPNPSPSPHLRLSTRSKSSPRAGQSNPSPMTSLGISSTVLLLRLPR